MTGILGLALPPWLNPTILGAAAIGIAGMTAGAYAVHRWDAGTIANARLQTAKVNADYAAYKGAVAASAAKANQDALNQQTALQGQINALQANLQDAQRIADAKSKALSKILATATPATTRLLGPTALSYYDGLRNGTAGHSADPGSP